MSTTFAQPPPPCQNYHAMYTYKAALNEPVATAPPTAAFAVNAPDYAYLQLEL